MLENVHFFYSRLVIKITQTALLCLYIDLCVICMWSDSELIFSVEFQGNVAADNRPDPLLDSEQEGDNSAADEDHDSAADSDDDGVRQEMMRVLSQQAAT